MPMRSLPILRGVWWRYIDQPNDEWYYTANRKQLELLLVALTGFSKIKIEIRP